MADNDFRPDIDAINTRIQNEIVEYKKLISELGYDNQFHLLFEVLDELSPVDGCFAYYLERAYGFFVKYKEEHPEYFQKRSDKNGTT